MDDNEDWEPKTALGRMVKAGEITNMKDVFNSNLPLIESNIVDALLPDLEEEVINISLVQRMHKSGRRVRFRATVAIGNNNGYIGIGKAVAKEVGPAIRKSIRVAKLNITESHEDVEVGNVLVEKSILCLLRSLVDQEV